MMIASDQYNWRFSEIQVRFLRAINMCWDFTIDRYVRVPKSQTQIVATNAANTWMLNCASDHLYVFIVDDLFSYSSVYFTFCVQYTCHIMFLFCITFISISLRILILLIIMYIGLFYILLLFICRPCPPVCSICSPAFPQGWDTSPSVSSRITFRIDFGPSFECIVCGFEVFAP